MSGNSIGLLRRRGLSVTRGVLEDECRSLNRGYEKLVRTGMPYVILKFAQTLDGKIALVPGRRTKITGTEADRAVHKLRSEADAILSGAGTVAADDPRLTVRLAGGTSPRRVILDGRFRSDPRARVFEGHGTILLTTTRYAERNRRKKEEFFRRGVTICELNSVGRDQGRFRMRDALLTMGLLGITSVLAEGGAQVLSGLLHEGLVDEILAFSAPKVFGKGLAAFGSLRRAPVPLRITGAHRFGGDILISSQVRKA
jgi:diaminohydroxyphosphoribosylaminopyrimidine deaminase/5-amino-6-(5-phosphoribosylamino)uracil reductase